MAAAPPPLALPAGQAKGWLATLAVLLIMVAIPVAGFVGFQAVASQPDRPIDVADGVTVVPPPGWQFAGRSDDGLTVLITSGSASIAISVEPGADEEAALAQLRDEWLALGTVSATDIQAVAGLRPGQETARFAYSGTFVGMGDPGPVEGDVTGVGGTNVAVTFDAWAGVGQFPTVRDDVDQVIRGATIP